MKRLWTALCAVVVAAASVAVATTASADTTPTPFGHTCAAQNGVRFCPTANAAQRVPSWDGTPIDVDVTLPASGSGPYPTIVILHGLGEDKTAFEDTSPNGSQVLTYHYNTNYYAQRGYMQSSRLIDDGLDWVFYTKALAD